MLKSTLKKYKRLPAQIRASFWFLICAFLQKGIAVISTPIFTRLLSTEEYGQYSVFSSWLSIITIFVTLNLFAGVYTQGLIKFESKRDEYTSALQGLCLLLVITWLLIYLLFHDFWNKIFSLTTLQMLAMFVIIWMTSVFSFWSIEQRVDFKYRSLVLVTILVSLAVPTIGVIFVINAEDKVTARIIGMAIVYIIAYSGFFFQQMRCGKKFYSPQIWKYALAYNIPLIPHYLSMSVLNSADRIMIQGMVGKSEAGIYSLAYSISLIMSLFNQALLQTIEPWLYKEIKRRQIESISKVAYPAFLLIAGVNILLIAFAPEAVAIFAPKDYYDAVWIIPPVAMSVYFMFLYTFFAVFEFYFEKTKYIAIATLSGAVANIVLNYIFINIFGYYAAGYTTLVCYIIYAVFHYCFAKKLCRTQLDNAKVYDTKILLSITVGFMALGFLYLLTYTNIIARYSLTLIIAIIFILKRKSIIYEIKQLSAIRKS